ncbi:phosphoribosylaminoimidazolesuccinocarboxamide synthase [Aspergillus candidus]|uniref:Phosphoribosylaminoimidazole-succinocarboxamide synthase n=1 Tax=Aspergillus candidus TaxID=41067 RepID=A0A2I2FF82_ASPCN|nr:phosphoribosylamidoimidazole-succinocarboxamidesynthase [Aspergillus candidus]PLB39296.1 phosphoribosylamidoimidazole-succinocarboxamidesynthase [Aspergillus candidus]
MASRQAGYFQSLQFPSESSVLIHDQIYGDHHITEPILVELLRSPTLQRLTGVWQSGITALFNLGPRVSRFEHSVGAFLLVRKVGASVAEQVAALLHDVSHTALSHVMDWALSKPGEDSYHEEHKARYIAMTPLPEILARHGFADLKPLEEHLYPLVERPAPHLCADRLDYALRDAVAYEKMSLSEAQGVFRAFAAFPDAESPARLMVLPDVSLALRLARAYMECDRNVWCNPSHIDMYKRTGQIIRDLVEQGKISDNDLWCPDDEFWALLRSASDANGIKELERLETEGAPKAKGLGLPPGAKVRTIDPDVYVSGEDKPCPLSVVDDVWARERQEYIQKIQYSLHLCFLYRSFAYDFIRLSSPHQTQHFTMADQAYTTTDLQGALPLVARGKVRDLYEVDEKTLLFIATDRISAYDVIMENGIPNKGVLLTLCTKTWFKILTDAIPGLRTHFLTLDLPPQIPASLRPVLQNRSMQVRKLKILPIEAIVRGYITGSAWNEYKKSGTVHGIPVAPGLQESQAFPDGPIYTPSTKAEQGEHDENIHPDQAIQILGATHASTVAALAIKLYKAAHEYALTRGVIIADTKFEFGLDEATNEVVLADEVLTPDSSRFWPKDSYAVGRGQQSFDKQFLRDWLVREGLKGKEGVRMSEEIALKTSEKYKEAWERITGGV